MAVNRGKKFEEHIKQSFLKVSEVSVDRLHDQTTRLKGSTNICDFVVYKKPYEYYIECKSVHGNTLCIHTNDPEHRYGNITNKQWQGLLEKSKIDGVFAGIICWWVDHDITKFIPIDTLDCLWKDCANSIRYDFCHDSIVLIQGKKNRIFFNYDMDLFFHEMEKRRRHA